MSKVPATLPKYESIFYFLAWSSGIGYSVYKLSLYNAYFSNYYDAYADFAPGWSWIGRKQDVSDQEWKIWIPLIVQLLIWIFLHHLIGRIIKATLNRMSLCCWYIFMSSLFLCYNLGAVGTLCILTQPTMSYFLTYKRNRLVSWLVHSAFLLLIHFLKMPDGFFQGALGLSDEEHYVVTLTMCWIQLRSISYNMDTIDTCHESDFKDTQIFEPLLLKLAYCMYLPTLPLGPLILYHEFVDSINKPLRYWNFQRLKVFVLNLIRYTFWIYVAIFSLHFVYFNAIQYHPEIVRNLNPWALYGLGYCMGQFFLIKYVVVYGLNRILCEIDDVKAPFQPKCIARIHLYSDMWKYFDRGLYNFLIKYIYTPMLKTNYNKFLASFFCFGFVFVWHGMQSSVFIWALLNFVGVSIESLARSVGQSKYYSKMQEKYLTLRNCRRFNCMLASPLLAMSAVSNFYFFAGQEIGDIYVQRTLNESWNALFVLLFCLYCCCQVSVDVKMWESQKSAKTCAFYNS